MFKIDKMYANTNQFVSNEAYYSNDLVSQHPATSDLSSGNMASMGSCSDGRTVFDPLTINPQATSTPANTRSQSVRWGPITNLSQGSEISFLSSGPISDLGSENSHFSTQPQHTESFNTQAHSVYEQHQGVNNSSVKGTYHSTSVNQQINSQKEHMLQSHQISTLASTLAANASHSHGATDSGIYLQKSHEEQLNSDGQQSHSFGQIAAHSHNDTNGIVSVEAQIQQQLREIQATLSNLSLLKQKQQQQRIIPNPRANTLINSPIRQAPVPLCDHRDNWHHHIQANVDPVHHSSIMGETQYTEPSVRRQVNPPCQTQQMQGNASGTSLQLPHYSTNKSTSPDASTAPPIQMQTHPTSQSFAMRQSQVGTVPNIQNQSMPSQPVHLHQAAYNHTPASYGMLNVASNIGQPSITTNTYCPQVNSIPSSVPPYNLPTVSTTFTPPYQGDFIQNRMPIKKEIYPDNFDGSNKTEWSDYIVHFEQVASWNQWTDAQKAQMLSIHLRGEAQGMLSDLTIAQLSNYQVMKQVITDRYEPKEKDVAYRCQFRYRKREKGESISDYGYQLNKLARKAFPNLTLSQLEMHVIDQFITGIGNYELQKHVQFGHPKSINAAIGLATEYEALEGSVDKVKKPHAGSEYIGPIVSNGKDMQSITLDQIDKLLDKKLSSLSSERRYKSNSPSPTRFPTHTTANEHKADTSKSDAKTERTNPVKFCNYCKKQNHTIEECRKRKYKERQAAEKQQTPPPPEMKRLTLSHTRIHNSLFQTLSILKSLTFLHHKVILVWEKRVIY